MHRIDRRGPEIDPLLLSHMAIVIVVLTEPCILLWIVLFHPQKILLCVGPDLGRVAGLDMLCDGLDVLSPILVEGLDEAGVLSWGPVTWSR